MWFTEAAPLFGQLKLQQPRPKSPPRTPSSSSIWEIARDRKQGAVEGADILTAQPAQVGLQAIGRIDKLPPVHAIEAIRRFRTLFRGGHPPGALQAARTLFQLVDRTHPVCPCLQMVAAYRDLKHALINPAHAPLLRNPERLQRLMAGEILASVQLF